MAAAAGRTCATAHNALRRGAGAGGFYGVGSAQRLTNRLGESVDSETRNRHCCAGSKSSPPAPRTTNSSGRKARCSRRR